MNQLLKAFLKEAADLVQVGKAATSKQYSLLFSALFQAGEDIPAIVSGFADLKPEIEKLLSDPAADADLLAYAAGLLGDDAKGKAIIMASADLILTSALKVEALLKAISMPSAPAVAVAASSEPESLA